MSRERHSNIFEEANAQQFRAAANPIPARPMPPIERASSRITSAIDDLTHALESLSLKIEPVLGPNTSITANDEDLRVGDNSPLADHLMSRAIKIDELTRTIILLTDRIEL